MNHLKITCLCLLLAVLVLLWGATANALDAGASAQRMTFGSGVPLAGDSARQGRAALGEHDPLWARCLYLNDGETVAYLITLDMHHIPQALYDRVISAAEGFASTESIFLTATYTGNGPGGMEERLPLRWADGRFDSTLLDKVTQSTLDAMTAARDAAQRATLGYGTAKQQVLSKNAEDSEGTIDDRIGVIRVDNADGQAIAIVTNFSAAPRLVPETHYYHFSADYPGAYYTSLESLSDPGCVALFMPGACGDQIPANPENQSGWAQIESIGRLLAIRTKEVANKMSFRDAHLKTHYREVSLPPTLAQTTFPPTAIVQALQIDGLLLTFLPFMPDASVGLELNRRLSKLGYETPLTVSMTNGYFKDVVSRESFASNLPTAQRHYFGPGMAEWLYAEMEALLNDTEMAASQGDQTEVIQSGDRDESMAVFTGDGWPRGFSRGTFFSHEIRAHYDEAILGAIRMGELRPVDSAWKRWPSLLDATPVALPALAASIRPWLNGIDGGTFAELEGAAAGADMPFDAFWLLQNTPAFLSRGDAAMWFQAPISTQIAITGDRAGAEATILGINLDWPADEPSMLSTVVPKSGHTYIQIGFKWQLGVLVGMNDAGVSVAVAKLGVQGSNGVVGPPLEFILRALLQHASTFEDALTRLRESTHLRDGQVLLSGPGEDGWRTAMVTLGESVSIRNTDEGILLGVDPSRDSASDLTLARYQHVADLLANERIVGVEELQRLLTAGSTLDEGRYRVWNKETRQSVILLPAQRQVYVAFPDEQGNPSAFEMHRLSGEAPHE